jgi:hypothetical protein
MPAFSDGESEKVQKQSTEDIKSDIWRTWQIRHPRETYFYVLENIVIFYSANSSFDQSYGAGSRGAIIIKLPPGVVITNYGSLRFLVFY